MWQTRLRHRLTAGGGKKEEKFVRQWRLLWLVRTGWSLHFTDFMGPRGAKIESVHILDILHRKWTALQDSFNLIFDLSLYVLVLPRESFRLGFLYRACMDPPPTPLNLSIDPRFLILRL